MQIFVHESCKYTSPQSVLDNMETRRSVAAGTFLYTASTCLLCIFACWAVCESPFLLEWWDSVTHPRSTDDIQKPLLIPWTQIPNTWEICKCGMRCTYQWKSNAWDEDHDWKRNKRIGMKYPRNDHCQPFTMMSHYIEYIFWFLWSTNAPQHNSDVKWGQWKSGIKRRGKGFWYDSALGILMFFFQEAQYKLYFNIKYSASVHAALAGLELYLYFWSYLFELVAV